MYVHYAVGVKKEITLLVKLETLEYFTKLLENHRSNTNSELLQHNFSAISAYFLSY